MKRTLVAAIVLATALAVVPRMTPLVGAQQRGGGPTDGPPLRPGQQYPSPVVDITLLAADPESDVVMPALSLLTLADGSIVLEGAIPYRRLSVTGDREIVAENMSILVDTRDATYRTFRVSRVGAGSDERIRNYKRAKGVVVDASRLAPPSAAEGAETTPTDLPRVRRWARRDAAMQRAPRLALISSVATAAMTAQQQSYYCFETGDVTITTYDPVGVWLVRSRSYAYVGEDYYLDPPFYASLSHAFNWQDPAYWRTTPLGTTWYRDSVSSWAIATPPSINGSLYADAEQYQYYFNTDFCPVGCGYTWVDHYLYARASRDGWPSHFSVGVGNKGGTYSFLLENHVTHASGGGCF